LLPFVPAYVVKVDLQNGGSKWNGKRTGEGNRDPLHVVTLFPEMFAAVTHSGISGRALERGSGRWVVESA
jgi:hypothetical protein